MINSERFSTVFQVIFEKEKNKNISILGFQWVILTVLVLKIMKKSFKKEIMIS